MKDPEELASALIGLWGWAQQNVRAHEPEIPRRLREHLGVDPAGSPVLTEQLSQYDHVNVQVALDALDGEHELIGLSLDHGFRVGLAELAGLGSEYGVQYEPGPPELVQVDVGDRMISCLKSGLLLLHADGRTARCAACAAPR